MKIQQILNVDLNVGNKEPSNQLAKTLNLFKGKNINFDIASDECGSIKKRTLIIRLENIEFIETIQGYCTFLQQDAISIAYIDNQKAVSGLLITATDYSAKDFNINYFNI